MASEPFKVGDLVKVSGYAFYGNPIVDFEGIVTRVREDDGTYDVNVGPNGEGVRYDHIPPTTMTRIPN